MGAKVTSPSSHTPLTKASTESIESDAAEQTSQLAALKSRLLSFPAALTSKSSTDHEIVEPTSATSLKSGASVSGAGATLPVVSAVFIHEVIPREEQLTSLSPDLTDEERVQEWDRLNVYFHRTYVGAAINAYNCGLISSEGLSRVTKASVEDLVRMRTDCVGSKHEWDLNVMELNSDVSRANALLPEHLHIASVPASTGDLSGMRLSTSFAEFEFSTAPPR